MKGRNASGGVGLDVGRATGTLRCTGEGDLLFGIDLLRLVVVVGSLEKGEGDLSITWGGRSTALRRPGDLGSGEERFGTETLSGTGRSGDEDKEGA